MGGFEIELEKIFPKLKRRFSPEYLRNFSNTPERQIVDYAAGIGSILRVHYLKPQNRLYKRFSESGVTERDDMISQALLQFHRYLNMRVRRD